MEVLKLRKVELKPMEELKYNIIKNLVNTNGNKRRASITLGVTIRTINRLIEKYKEEGKQGFSHKNKNKKPKHTIDEFTKDRIINLYIDKYSDFNFKHFLEKLNEIEDIEISYNTLYNLLKSHFFLSPKAQRITKRNYRKALEEKLETKKKLELAEQNQIVENNILDPKSNHARVPRRKYMGELIQMDASEHLWFGTTKTHLHAAIDDASGIIVGLYFDHQETLNGYYNVLFQCINTHGIPYEFLTDRRTVFEYNKIKNPQPENNTLTQFSYACDQLGISIKTTSVPQAKGRIERLFGTLQSRLINELKIRNIVSIDQANEFLKEFIIDYNNRFSLINNNIPHVFVDLNPNDDLTLILAVVTSRLFDNGSSIKYMNQYYHAYDSNGNLVNFKKKTKAIIIKTFDNRFLALVNNKYYTLVEIPTHQETSKEFDFSKTDEKVDKPKYVVPNSHPWKAASYEAYLKRQGLESNV